MVQKLVGVLRGVSQRLRTCIVMLSTDKEESNINKYFCRVLPVKNGKHENENECGNLDHWWSDVLFMISIWILVCPSLGAECYRSETNCASRIPHPASRITL